MSCCCATGQGASSCGGGPFLEITLGLLPPCQHISHQYPFRNPSNCVPTNPDHALRALTSGHTHLTLTRSAASQPKSPGTCKPVQNFPIQVQSFMTGAFLLMHKIKHRKSNIMRRQRKMLATEVYYNTSEKELGETELSNPPDKVFKLMTPDMTEEQKNSVRMSTKIQNRINHR